jgi:hypothetical protein
MVGSLRLLWSGSKTGSLVGGDLTAFYTSLIERATQYKVNLLNLNVFIQVVKVQSWMEQQLFVKKKYQIPVI